jgi:hypothetical protein
MESAKTQAASNAAGIFQDRLLSAAALWVSIAERDYFRASRRLLRAHSPENFHRYCFDNSPVTLKVPPW